MLLPGRFGLTGRLRSKAPDPTAQWHGGASRRAVTALGHSHQWVHRTEHNQSSTNSHRGDISSASGRGRGRSSAWSRSQAGAGRGRWHNEGRRGNPDDLNAYPNLPSLAEAIRQRAPVWQAVGDIRTFKAAFTFAPKVGMRRPGELPRDGGPDRAALLHDVMRTLAAAYLPLVTGVQRQPDDIVLPLWACAKAGYWEGGLAEAMSVRLMQGGGELLQRALGREHSRLWWSLSEAPPGALQGLRVAELLRVSEERLLRMGPSELNPQICSNVLLAAARLQLGSEALLHYMAAGLCELLPEATTQELANTLYSLGKLAEERGHTPRQQDLQRLAGEVVARLAAAGQQQTAAASSSAPTFTPQALFNMLWGCAKLGYTDSVLLQPLAAAAGRAAERSNAQELATSVYALAVLGCGGPEYAPALQSLMAEAARRLRQRPSEFRPQHLSNTLWALALLQPPGSEELRDAAAGECQRRGFANFKAQEISNAAWALTRLGVADRQDWYTAAVEAAVQPDIMRYAGAQDHSNLLYALARVRHQPPAALLAGMAVCLQLRSQATTQGCANSLWALAVLCGNRLDLDGEDAQTVLRLVDVLAGRLGQLLRRKEGDEMPVQELANGLWALAVMGPAVLSRHASLVEGLLRKAVRRWEAGEGSGFNLEASMQLRQAQLELAHQGYGGWLPRSFCNDVHDAIRSDLQQHGPSISALQRQVISALTRLQQRQQPASGSSTTILNVEEERWVPELGCWVDIAVELEGGRRVAMEVDGPTHFLANPPYTRVKDGPTLLRDRQLARVFGQGNVVCVPYWEWNARKGQDTQEEYLCGLLTTSLPAARDGASPAHAASSAPEPQQAASSASSGKRGRKAAALAGFAPSPPAPEAQLANSGGKQGRKAAAPAEPALAPEPQQANSGVRQRRKARAGEAESSPMVETRPTSKGAKRRVQKEASAPGPAPSVAPESQADSSAQQSPQEPTQGKRLLVPRTARRPLL